MFEGTLRENLDPENIMPLEKIREVLQKGQIFMSKENKEENDDEEFLNKEKKGNKLNENLLVEKNGRNLSNGEKQIMNFLRAMLLNRDIVFLDEATSNLDPSTGKITFFFVIELFFQRCFAAEKYF